MHFFSENPPYRKKRFSSMKIFFSGIAGSGMSAIAIFMAKRGHSVSGSDRVFDRNRHHPLYNIFINSDIRIFPQDGSGIDKSLETVVFSTAVEKNNPDYIKATDEGAMIRTRPDFLSELSREFKTIAVAGTSGKSTTSGMLAFIMHRLGLKPNYIGGGRVKMGARDDSLSDIARKIASSLTSTFQRQKL